MGKKGCWKCASGYKAVILPLLFDWYLRTAMPWADLDWAAAKAVPMSSRAGQEGQWDSCSCHWAVLRHRRWCSSKFLRLHCSLKAKNESTLQRKEAAPLWRSSAPSTTRENTSTMPFHREIRNPYKTLVLLLTASTPRDFSKEGRHCNCISRPCCTSILQVLEVLEQCFPSLNAHSSRPRLISVQSSQS